jgi:hypothetical protein
MDPSTQKNIIFSDLYKALSEEDKQHIDLEISKNRLKTKILTTLLYKENKYEDYTKVKKRVNSCLKNCYDQVDLDNLDQMPKSLKQLKKCSNDCKMPLLDVQNYFDNTDFMSIFKLEYCATGCFSNTEAGSPARLDCYFNCYSRLDRRYRNYWLEHRNKLINRYFHNLY